VNAKHERNLAMMIHGSGPGLRGNDQASRLSRRQGNWIGDVMFEEAC